MSDELTVTSLYEFLKNVDNEFPVPLSQKRDLMKLSQKLISDGTLCTKIINNKIVSLVAGYTENLTENRAYISIVATDKKYQGKGYAKALVKDFIEICKSKNIVAVHLYTVSYNATAVNMYKNLGFIKWEPKNEPRKKDLHLIYNIGEQKK